MLERTRSLFIVTVALLGSVCLCHHAFAAPEKKAAATGKTGKKAKAAADKAEKAAAGAGKKGNLISNGDFGQWPDAAAAPAGWTYTPSAFTIRRVEDKIQGSGFSAEQTWTKADGADSIFNLFGIDVDGIKPDTTYRLSFRAKNKAGEGIMVCPWAIDRLEAPERNYGLTIEVKRTPGDDFVKYEDVFNSGKATRIRFVTACTSEKLPVTVVWDDWKLVEVPAGK